MFSSLRSINYPVPIHFYALVPDVPACHNLIDEKAVLILHDVIQFTKPKDFNQLIDDYIAPVMLS